MNSTHSVNTFLEMLIEDSAEYRQLEINGLDLAEKKKMIRSLMNIRMPNPVSNELLNLQDAYLKNELSEKGIVTLADIPTIKEQFNSTFPYSDKISIWQGDITRLKTGAIVNAANSQMLGCFVPCHKCIDNAIHSSAGMQLREECSRIMNQIMQGCSLFCPVISVSGRQNQSMNAASLQSVPDMKQPGSHSEPGCFKYGVCSHS